MIKFITVEDVLPLRNEVLREGRLTLDECRFPSDTLEGVFHLGYYKDGELACVTSIHPQAYGGFSGVGYQLRGMATIEKYRGQGLGNQLVNFAIVYLRGQKAGYLWCNGRIKAIRFYQNCGFEIISPEFVIPGTGPHHVLYVKIR